MQAIHGIIDVLMYKKLTIDELRYVVNSVIMGKLRNYAVFTPLTDADIFALDTRLQKLARQSLKLAQGTSPHILYYNHVNPCAIDFPSVRDNITTDIAATFIDIMNTGHDLRSPSTE